MLSSLLKIVGAFLLLSSTPALSEDMLDHEGLNATRPPDSSTLQPNDVESPSSNLSFEAAIVGTRGFNYNDYDDDDDDDYTIDKAQWHYSSSYGTCKDDYNFRFQTEYVGRRDCQWLSEKSNRKKKYCETRGWDGRSSRRVKHFCQDSCVRYLNRCGDYDDRDDYHYEDKKCYDDDEFRFRTDNNGRQDCDWLSERRSRQRKYCDGRFGADKRVKFACRRTCANFLSGSKYEDSCDKYIDEDYDNDSYSGGNSNGRQRCRDRNDFRFRTRDGRRDCDWLANSRSRQSKYCNTRGWDGKSSRRVKYFCEDSCSRYLGRCRSNGNNHYDSDSYSGSHGGSHSGGYSGKGSHSGGNYSGGGHGGGGYGGNCRDSNNFRFNTEHVGRRDCDWLSAKTDRQEKYCRTRGWDGRANQRVRDACRRSCRKYNNNC